jgi:hypothetical protein
MSLLNRSDQPHFHDIFYFEWLSLKYAALKQDDSSTL